VELENGSTLGTIGLMRILVVDGEPDFATACERTFEKEHEVVSARSGFAALDRIAIGRPFDVILCTVALPDMTGIEVHRRLAACAPGVAGRMVFVTDDVKAHRAFFESVRSSWLEKPVAPSALRQIVRDLGLR
jgi:CheY-like chemotaxis protein